MENISEEPFSLFLKDQLESSLCFTLRFDSLPNEYPIPLPPSKEMEDSSNESKKGILLGRKRPTPSKAKKTVQYKQSLHDIGSKKASDKRKRQLERNRNSARESRKKKKAYIQQLEAQVRKVIKCRIQN